MVIGGTVGDGEDVARTLSISRSGLDNDDTVTTDICDITRLTVDVGRGDGRALMNYLPLVHSHRSILRLLAEALVLVIDGNRRADIGEGQTADGERVRSCGGTAGSGDDDGSYALDGEVIVGQSLLLVEIDGRIAARHLIGVCRYDTVGSSLHFLLITDGTGDVESYMGRRIIEVEVEDVQRV